VPPGKGDFDNMGTYGGPAHLKFGRPKNAQKSMRFWTTSDFDHKYLQNEWGYRQVENGFINYDPYHIRQKTGELWSTNIRYYTANVCPP